jgi:dipicolinate synthase subunit B
MEKIRLGFAMTGSFCTLERVFDTLSELCPERFDVYPILSETVMSMDTRFMTREEIVKRLALITEHQPITRIDTAEPIGPKKLFDALVIAPCTGNTLAKLASGITDTAVTMAAKAHLRRDKTLVIALATNDAMSQNLGNIAKLITRRSVYFVRLRQDDPRGKPHSLVAEMAEVPASLDAALRGEQMRPLFLS